MQLLAIELYTPDINATHRFYVSQLGLPVLSHSAHHLTVLVGWTRLIFRHIDRPVAPYYLAINVPHGSLDVLMYYLNLVNSDTHRPCQAIPELPDWPAEACYFYDPVGNLLKFIARTDLSLETSNLTFDALFQGVSAISLATEDVGCTTEQLQRRFAIPLLGKSTPTSDYNALGDGNGLFMLVQAGSKWLFPKLPVGLNFCRIHFADEPGRRVWELYSYEVNQIPIGKGSNLFSGLLADHS